MTSITLNAPAKVNLFLKIFNKRKDGYHNILTVFERISLADRITITKIPKGIVVISDKFIVRDYKANLAYKAARAILSESKIRSGARICIKKKIPIAAGMGGGSSDAAAVLAGMNKLFGLKIKKTGLMRLGRRLGADVPFFLLDSPFAVARSIGDRLTKMDLQLRLWHLVIYPGFRLSTKDVYAAFDAAKRRKAKVLTMPSSDDKIGRPLEDALDFCNMQTMLFNDLEKIVISKRKVVGNIIRRLATSSTSKAILSGSGPSVFCLYRTRKEAMRAKIKFLRSMPPVGRKGWQIFVAKTLN